MVVNVNKYIIMAFLPEDQKEHADRIFAILTGKHQYDIHTDIQSLKDKYPQFNITVSVEEKI